MNENQATAASIAAGLGITKPSASRDGHPVFHLPTVCHGGDGRNLHVWDGGDGGIGAKCQSSMCAYSDITSALGVDTPRRRGHECGRYCLAFEHPSKPPKVHHREDFDAACWRTGCDAQGRHKHLDLRENRGSFAGYFIRVSGVATDSPVILVEGTKTFLAVTQAGRVAACWTGGASNIQAFDFATLSGRDVVIAPDNDDAGRLAAEKAAALLRKAGGRVAGYLDAPAGSPRGWDVADILEAADRSDFLAQTPRVDAPQVFTLKPEIGADVQIEKSGVGWRQTMLALNLEARYNLRSVTIETRAGLEELRPSGLTSEWQPHGDGVDAWVQEYTAIRFVHGTSKPARWPMEDWRRMMLAMAWENRVDPFKIWLTTLPDWDGVARCERLFVDLLAADDNELNRQAARRLLIGAVARSQDPGRVHDWIPVLIGPQGCGKGSVIQGLVPDHVRGSWSREGVDLSVDTKQKAEQIGSAVIVEFSELAGLKQTNVEHLKTWISRTEDSFRPAYGRSASIVKRHWVGIASANNNASGVLPRERGNRRFVAVAVGEGLDDNSPEGATQARRAREYLAAHRDQLWAEALAAYHQDKSVGSHLIPPELYDMQNAANSLYDAHEFAAITAEDITEKHAGGDALQLVTLMVEMGVAANEIEALADKSGMKKVAAALVGMKWVKRRVMVDGKQNVRWFPPTLRKPAAAEPTESEMTESEKFDEMDEEMGTRDGVTIETAVGEELDRGVPIEELRARFATTVEAIQVERERAGMEPLIVWETEDDRMAVKIETAADLGDAHRIGADASLDLRLIENPGKCETCGQDRDHVYRQADGEPMACFQCQPAIEIPEEWGV